MCSVGVLNLHTRAACPMLCTAGTHLAGPASVPQPSSSCSLAFLKTPRHWQPALSAPAPGAAARVCGTAPTPSMHSASAHPISVSDACIGSAASTGARAPKRPGLPGPSMCATRGCAAVDPPPAESSRCGRGAPGTLAAPSASAASPAPSGAPCVAAPNCTPAAGAAAACTAPLNDAATACAGAGARPGCVAGAPGAAAPAATAGGAAAAACRCAAPAAAGGERKRSTRSVWHR